MDSELLKSPPLNFQIWARIEAEAQKRAAQRLKEIIDKEKEEICTVQAGAIVRY